MNAMNTQALHAIPDAEIVTYDDGQPPEEDSPRQQPAASPGRPSLGG